ncbi:GNAT family N-acetyltransferase [Mycolicibacterium sp. 22603]|uniref:GNAT family N-acetyltransferase n=1 Tax=Mycolicibacterium TaxID=1866885 RepID=UPI00248ADBB9|nr:GNAT family protein [Mycolicibacterium neoaurum]WBP92725.1 GNAT family protein [Mycolicibacterium neoaurum]WBS06287.1 GNAT family protein [Mycolicibacterium neoaurum]
MSEIWPLFGLRVRTPRLTLTYADDELGFRLAELAARGIHDPSTMPFSEPWTDAPANLLQRNAMQYYWRCRANTCADDWDIVLAASDREHQLVGMCTLTAARFPTLRVAGTGSWLGLSFQGRGLGLEMRHAALHLLFAGLGGERATTRAWHDNAASLGVTRSLPYSYTGASLAMRRDRPDTMLSFSMDRRQWSTQRRDDIGLEGIPAVRAQLGL